MTHELSLFLLKTTAYYFLAINALYGLLMLFSWMKVKSFRRAEVRLKAQTSPGITFLIPVYNEETLIVETIQTYLSLPQENKEIIVINDGSHDQTLRLLQVMFQLRRSSSNHFQSITFPQLKVLEAPHLGKAQALNFGVSQAQHDLICTMDADTIPNARGVETCLRAFAQDQKLIAVGGVIQVLNPQTAKWLPTFQRIEYLRAFVCERLGWSFLRSTVLISGAFCMIKKEAVLKVGGFSKKSITEDLDLVLRLRKAYRREKNSFRILPVTTCYTQVPSTYQHLRQQRLRWQQGLVQTLSQHATLILHPGHGLFGLIAIPYMWLVEVLSPLLEATALLVVPYSLSQGWISLEMASLYFGLGILFNVMITVFGIYLDNRYVSRGKNWSLFKSAFHTVAIHFGYKQLNSWWRFMALLKSMMKANWGQNRREEIIPQGT